MKHNNSDPQPLTEQQIVDFMANPVFKRFIADTDHALIRAWQTSAKVEDRETAWYMSRALHMLEPWCKKHLVRKPDKRVRTK